MTVTLIELQQELEAFTQRRRRFQKQLAAISDPEHRAELAGRVARMMDHEEAQREILGKIELEDKLEPYLRRL